MRDFEFLRDFSGINRPRQIDGIRASVGNRSGNSKAGRKNRRGFVFEKFAENRDKARVARAGEPLFAKQCELVANNSKQSDV